MSVYVLLSNLGGDCRVEGIFEAKKDAIDHAWNVLLDLDVSLKTVSAAINSLKKGEASSVLSLSRWPIVAKGELEKYTTKQASPPKPKTKKVSVASKKVVVKKASPTKPKTATKKVSVASKKVVVKKASPAKSKGDLSSMTVIKLKEMAKKSGVSLTGITKKADIIKAIEKGA